MNTKIKIGDIVTFTDEGTYAKWFYGRMGTVVSMNDRGTHISVEWIIPVTYFGKLTGRSSFEISRFTKLKAA